MTEWNNWREENPNVEIWLQGADLSNAHLERGNLVGAYMQKAVLSRARLKRGELQYAHLERAYLWDAHLEEANLAETHLASALLDRVHLERANLAGAQLEEAVLNRARLTRAELRYAHLEKARLLDADLRGADLRDARLEGVDLKRAHLEEAKLSYAHLENAYLSHAHTRRAVFDHAHLGAAVLISSNLEGASFITTIVDGLTLFWECTVDQATDFRGVGLETCRIDEPTKYLLKYNRRRMNCEDWYKQHPRFAWPVKAFFWMSDYGRSTGRIIFTFFGLALIFAGIYYICALVSSCGIVSNLFEGKEGPVPGWLVPFRTIYFSIVTMTTLGFGDMHANCQSFWGHFLLTVQVILGYVLLAALVTRIGVLFTSGVIAGEFKDSSRKSGNNE